MHVQAAPVVVRKGRPLIPTVTSTATSTPIMPNSAPCREIRKKPGFGVPLRSGIGGHSVLYLNGVRRDREAGYPTLKVCNPDASPERHGVGISVNSHYKNANWIAAEGRDFVWHGALAPGEHLTSDAYARTQQCAKTLRNPGRG